MKCRREAVTSAGVDQDKTRPTVLLASGLTATIIGTRRYGLTEYLQVEVDSDGTRMLINPESLPQKSPELVDTIRSTDQTRTC